MSLYSHVQEQIKTSFNYIQDKFDAGLLETVLHPNQVIKFWITIPMDDGTYQTFQAFRSQHNNAKGPYKGGLRFHPQVSEDEVMSLSAWMSLKTSVVGLPLGGGKGGIIVDPKALSQAELERLSRTFMQKLAPFIGPDVDVPAPDVNTNPQIMAWMADEYAKVTGKRTPGVITGKPLEVGGSKGRGEATSLGGFFVLDQYLKSIGETIVGKTIIVQGAGNVGLNFAKIAASAGAKVIGISDSRGNAFNPDGLDLQSIIDAKAEKKHLCHCASGQDIPQEEFLLQKCDILVPAALENQIHKANADQIQAKIVLELANGPVTYDADTILQEKNIQVIPDVLANAGGVTVSYFEQVQNNSDSYRELEEVNTKLEKIMRTSTEEVLKTSHEHGVRLREGAYISALERILLAEQTKR